MYLVVGIVSDTRAAAISIEIANPHTTALGAVRYVGERKRRTGHDESHNDDDTECKPHGPNTALPLSSPRD